MLTFDFCQLNTILMLYLRWLKQRFNEKNAFRPTYSKKINLWLESTT